jgi:hypothetical protein
MSLRAAQVRIYVDADLLGAETAAYIGRWRPSSVSPRAAAFAREVITVAAPADRERAKNLLWAAGRLADFAASLGLDLEPEVVFHPSVIERFARCAPGLSGVARRTLRTNQRFIARRVVPQLYPADVPLPRERAKAPYSAPQIGGFLALAAAQPTAQRRMRPTGLVCLGAGAGLIRADLWSDDHDADPDSFQLFEHVGAGSRGERRVLAVAEGGPGRLVVAGAGDQPLGPGPPPRAGLHGGGL